jgi:hypothetical protein
MEEYKEAEEAINKLIESVFATGVKLAKSNNIEKNVIKEVVETLKNKYTANGLKLLVIPGSTPKKPSPKKKDDSTRWRSFNEEYSYTTSIKNNNKGYIRENASNFIVAQIDNDGEPVALSDTDILFLSGKGLGYKRV